MEISSLYQRRHKSFTTHVYVFIIIHGTIDHDDDIKAHKSARQLLQFDFKPTSCSLIDGGEEERVVGHDMLVLLLVLLQLKDLLLNCTAEEE